MPNLPTMAINDQATWDRVMTAFNADPVYYKKWLKRALIDEVRRTEAIAAGQQAQVDLETNIPTA